jgi:hypothetical protein
LELNNIRDSYKGMPLISHCETQDMVLTPPLQVEPCREEKAIEQIPQDKKISDNFEFPLDMDDTLFTFTLNPSIYKVNVSNLISKAIVINELCYIDLDTLSKVLAAMHIKELNIFSIDDEVKEIKKVKRDNGSSITYVEMTRLDFATLLNNEKVDFLDYNRYSLYILRYGGFLDIKNLFTKINGHDMNVGRGGSQKAHFLSPLDFRLSAYIMAMFNCNYGLISNLNAFNSLDKDRYLSYFDRTSKNKS